MQAWKRKLIRNWTGHRSNALFKREKINEVKSTGVSEALKTSKCSTSNKEMTKDTGGTFEIGIHRPTEFM